MLIAEKVSLNSQVYGGSFCLKIYTMERNLYKQIKLDKDIDKKNKNLNLKQYVNNETSKLQAVSLISYFSKKKKRIAAINQ